MKRVFYVESAAIDGDASWDQFGGVFESEAAAIAAAEFEWSHTGAADKAGREVSVFYADIPDDIDADAAYDYILANDCGGYVVCTFRA